MQLPPGALTTTLRAIGACAVIASAIAVIAGRMNRPARPTAPLDDPASSTILSARDQDGMMTGELRLSGRAIDLDRRPIADAEITLDRRRTTRSAVDGWFAFDQVAAGTHALMAQDTAGDAERYGELPAVRLDRTSDAVEIELSAGPTVVLHVVDRTGAPLAGATAAMQPWHSRVTDRDGIVRLRGDRTGIDSLDVTAPAHASLRLYIAADDPRAVIERSVTLEPGAPISGTVLDPDGHPAADATVWVDTEGGTWRDCATTDDAGAWHIDGIAAGKHVVYANAWRFADAPDVVFQHDAIQPRTGLALHLRRANILTGSVVDAAGQPVASATVSFGSEGSPRGITSVNQLGRFAVDEQAGRATQVYATTSTAASQIVTIGPGDRRPHRLVLAPSSIAGTVVDTSGAGIEGATVRARGPHDSFLGWTDAHGRFEFGVPAGTYELTVSHGSHVHDPAQSLTVRAGQHDATLVVPSLAAITGRVVAGGRSVPAFGIVLTAMTELVENGRPRVVHGADGRFTLTGLDPGEDRVTIVAPGFLPRTVERIVLAAGATTDLSDIALERGRGIAGRVIDESGAPVVGALVTVYEKRPPSRSDDGWRDLLVDTRVARTGRGGRYRLDGLPSTTALRIEAAHRSGRASIDQALASDQTEVVLTVVPTGGIRGTIEGLHASFATRVIATPASDSASHYEAETHAAGSFHFDQLPPGDYDLMVGGADGFQHTHATVVAGARTLVTMTKPAR